MTFLKIVYKYHAILILQIMARKFSNAFGIFSSFEGFDLISNANVTVDGTQMCSGGIMFHSLL